MNKLEELLIERGISQAWLAKKINNNHSTLNRWIKENRTPPYETMLKISKALKTTVRKIFDDEVIAGAIFKCLPGTISQRKIINNRKI